MAIAQVGLQWCIALVDRLATLHIVGAKSVLLSATEPCLRTTSRYPLKLNRQRAYPFGTSLFLIPHCHFHIRGAFGPSAPLGAADDND